MLQRPMQGSAKVKRKSWSRKGWKQELHFSIKKQKKQFQRQLRNGKNVELVDGNYYRKVANGNAKWELVS